MVLRRDSDPFDGSPLYILGNQYGTFAYSVASDSWGLCTPPKHWIDTFPEVSWLELLVTSGISRQQAADINIIDSQRWYKTEEVVVGSCTSK